MADVFSPAKRSAIMSRVRSRGNASTELRVVRALRQAGITGWRRHLPHVPGSPDFVFPKARVALHVHGCFWHGCTRCSAGDAPATRRNYWIPKVARNRARDARNRRALRRAGYRTLQVWEHELRENGWLRRLRRRLSAAG
ncbi:MAG: DNA mismatch endonuclease Vsr [Deltaproteobacteria bacterium]|nr:DNA mismatch endonuclease Vsr [Deltaproteobacteria bacterium]